MQAPVDICYAGVVVARAQEVREGEGGALFVAMKEPLPVGTLVGLRSADSEVTLRVAHVVETSDTVDNGMHVRPVGAEDADSTMWIPPPPARPVNVPVVLPVAIVPPAANQVAPVEVAAPTAVFQAVVPEAAAPPVKQAPAPASEPPTKAVESEPVVEPAAKVEPAG
ncbi:MAG TPA: hypothetical protein VF518_07340, partial [Polyangia bacterium]